MSGSVHVVVGDVIVNGLALGGLWMIAVLVWESARESGRRRRRRLKAEARRRATVE